MCNIWVYKNKHKHCNLNNSSIPTSSSLHTTATASDKDRFIHITDMLEENVMFLVPISMPKSALGLDNIFKKKITRDQECQTDFVTTVVVSENTSTITTSVAVEEDGNIPVELSQPFSDHDMESTSDITAEQILNKIRNFWINSEDYYLCDRVRFDCVYDIVMFPPSTNHEEMKTDVFNLWNEECSNKLQYDRSRELNYFI